MTVSNDMFPEGYIAYAEAIEVTGLVLDEVNDERMEQDSKWGQQNHPIHSTGSFAMKPEHFHDEADLWKRENDFRVKKGAIGWDGILLEEVYEALAETDPAKQREELVQVAAVAVAAIECIDRAAK